VLIENAPGAGDVVPGGDRATIRARYGLDLRTPVILYTGTFEAYRARSPVPLAMKDVLHTRPDARLLLAGGRSPQVEQARRGTGRSVSARP
jgi:hypothetical protein